MEMWQIGVVLVVAILALLLVIGIIVAAIRGVLGTSDIIEALGRIEVLLSRIDRRLSKEPVDLDVEDFSDEDDDLAGYR